MTTNAVNGVNGVKGRNELKFAISSLDCYLLRSQLRHLMKPDPHTRGDGTYHIRSVYFDNFDNKVLTEKKEGFYNRDKYRIRFYNLNRDYMTLEKKSKRNNLTFKQKSRITPAEYERIRFGDISWMAEDERDLIRELFIQMNVLQLKPMTVVDYEREVFIYEHGNVRITFDSSVKSSFRNIDLLNPDLAMIEVLEPDQVILEVKYDEYMPDVIKRMLQQLGNRRKEAFSKYQLSRMYG